MRIVDKNTQNKEPAKALYSLMFNACKPREAIERFVGAETVQHNPHVAGGNEAFPDYRVILAARFPGKRVHF